MQLIRQYLNIILNEANIHVDEWKFWYNANTGQHITLGGSDHHVHLIYYSPEMFGLTPGDVAYLNDHPSMQDAAEDDDGGGRIIYDGALFWKVMQHGWVRGGLEGEYDGDDHEIMHPYGLYLEGKSLADVAEAARYVTEQVEGDPEWPDRDKDWSVTTLSIAIRLGSGHATEQNYRLGERQIHYFLKTGRIPSKR